MQSLADVRIGIIGLGDVGNSPERINPGDKEYRLNVRNITSGSTPEATDFVDHLYASVIQAGTCRASSIRVAEAAKVKGSGRRADMSGPET